MIAPLPMRAPSMSQKALMTVFAPTVTPGPKRTLGPIVTSVPNFVSAESQTVPGSVMVTPPAIAACAQPLLQRLLGHRQLDAGIDALELRLLARHGNRLVAGRARDPHRIGQVELALHVVVADRTQQLRDQPAVDAHHAGIAEVDRALGGIGILALDDPDQFASLDDQATIGRWITRLEAQHADSRPGLAAGGNQLAEAFGRHQRRIAEHDQNRPVMALERPQGGPGGVPRAQRLVLHGRRMRREGPGHPGGAGSDHADDPAGLQRGCIGQHMGHHREVRQRMQDLRQGRLHAGSGAGCEHDHGNR